LAKNRHFTPNLVLNFRSLLSFVFQRFSPRLRGSVVDFVPDSCSSAFISGKVLLLLFRFRAMTAMSRDHGDLLLRFLLSSVFQGFLRVSAPPW